MEWENKSNKYKKHNERIRRISIDKFYEIVTGEKDAFANLCKVLPKVITKIMHEMKPDKQEDNTVFKELKQKNNNLLKALYLLAFKSYEGFDKF